MHSLGTTERDYVVTLPGAEITVASRSRAKLLITAATPEAVETLARRIHGGGPRAQFPFVQKRARDFPVNLEALNDYCVRFLDGAAGGTVFVSAIEETPPTVQDVLIELLAGLESARPPSAAVRLISGTTVSLVERVAAGTFCGRLFYRLNTIHLMAGVVPAEVART